MSDWTENEAAAASAMAAEGLSSGQIARRLGRTRNSVIGWCRRNDVPLRGTQGCRGWSGELDSALLKMADGRSTLESIAEYVDRDEVRVMQRLRSLLGSEVCFLVVRVKP